MKALFAILLSVASTGYALDGLTVVKVESTRRGYEYTTQVEVASPLLGKRKKMIDIVLPGRLTDSEGRQRVLINDDATIVAFNVRYGVGIYGMALVTLRKDRSDIVIKHLERVVRKQMAEVDVSLNEESLLLDRIDRNTLRIKYTGQEVSPHYFSLYVSVENGKICLDKSRLRRDMRNKKE